MPVPSLGAPKQQQQQQQPPPHKKSRKREKITLKCSELKQQEIFIIFHSFCESGIQEWLDWEILPRESFIRFQADTIWGSCS